MIVTAAKIAAETASMTADEKARYHATDEAIANAIYYATELAKALESIDPEIALEMSPILESALMNGLQPLLVKVAEAPAAVDIAPVADYVA